MTAKPAQPEYFLVTRKELDFIKNDCVYPERQFCDGCEYADGEDDTRASGLGCNFEGANAVMDRVLSRPAPAAEDNRKLIEEIIKKFHELEDDMVFEEYLKELCERGGERR